MLYVVPTPIGNLEDITYRALRILKEVDVIACEDTRVSIKLLNHFEIKNKMISYHQHNENSIAEKLIEMLKSGCEIALISDAGTPAISDPGEKIIQRCIEENLSYTILPGANAIIPAIVASNFSSPFTYIGFLNRTNRKKTLDEFKKYKTNLMIYESPHRIKSTLKDLLDVFGNRKICIVREISKLYEEFIHTDIEKAILKYMEITPKGEFAIVIEGYTEPDIVYEEKFVISEAKRMLELGIRKKDIAKELSSIYAIDRNDLYKQMSDW